MIQRLEGLESFEPLPLCERSGWVGDERYPIFGV